MIDDVPPHGGVINNNVQIGFDAHEAADRQLPEVRRGRQHPQVYSARLEDGAWKSYQTTDWDYRWDFSGGGTIPFEIHFGPVHAERDGTLSQSFSHVKYGSGIWKLDPATLKPIATTKPAAAHPPELDKVTSDFPGMQVKWQGDAGHDPKPAEHYEMRWETLGINRDHPREKPWPDATMLRVYEFAS